MKKSDVYSYIVSSIDIIDKKVNVQEKNVVSLFSYLYNYTVLLEDNISKLSLNVAKYESQLGKYQQEIENYNTAIKGYQEEIKNLKSTQNDNEKKITKMTNDINAFKKDVSNTLSKKVNNIIINEVHEEYNLKVWFKRKWNKVKTFFKNLYDKIYKIINRKKIEQEIEEQKRKEIEEAEKQRKERLKQIKKILDSNK